MLELVTIRYLKVSHAHVCVCTFELIQCPSACQGTSVSQLLPHSNCTKSTITPEIMPHLFDWWLLKSLVLCRHFWLTNPLLSTGPFINDVATISTQGHVVSGVERVKNSGDKISFPYEPEFMFFKTYFCVNLLLIWLDYPEEMGTILTTKSL